MFTPLTITKACAVSAPRQLSTTSLYIPLLPGCTSSVLNLIKCSSGEKNIFNKNITAGWCIWECLYVYQCACICLSVWVYMRICMSDMTRTRLLSLPEALMNKELTRTRLLWSLTCLLESSGSHIWLPFNKLISWNPKWTSEDWMVLNRVQSRSPDPQTSPPADISCH